MYKATRKYIALGAVLIALTVVGLIAAPLALARIARNTIDPVATVADDGRHLVVTGPIECTRGERAYIGVTVTQRLSGALAEGQTLVAPRSSGRSMPRFGGGSAFSRIWR